jgi:(p)ppGpp synthase/HD superfamily hydrolase
MTGKLSPVEQHGKQLMAMRYWLLGREYHTANAAMEFAREFHVGYRKNGFDPEFSHQIFLANYLRTLLPSLMHPEETLASIFLHDVCEDYDIGFDEIEKQFGGVVAHAVRLLTKKHRGAVIPYETYFAEMAKNSIASLVKGADRAHNIFTMRAAGWTLKKQASYLEEVNHWFFPMLKFARRNFPQQEPAYENVKTLLSIQSTHIRLHLEQAHMLANIAQSVEEASTPDI